jgi:hypothetical protein
MAATLRSAAVSAVGQVSPFENTETVVSLVTVYRPISEVKVGQYKVESDLEPIEAPTDPRIAKPAYKFSSTPPQPIVPPRVYKKPVSAAEPEPEKPRRTLSSAVILGGAIFLCLALLAAGAFVMSPELFGTETPIPAAPVVVVADTPQPTTTALENTATPTIGSRLTIPATETATATSTAAPGAVVEGLFFCLEPCLPNGSNAVSVVQGGITQIYVRWEYENFPNGAEYVRRWTNDGQEWVRYQCIWPGPSSGADEVPLTEPEGLRSGVWEVSVLLDDVVIAQEQLTVTGNWTFWSPAGVFNSCYGRR